MDPTPDGIREVLSLRDRHPPIEIRPRSWTPWHRLTRVRSLMCPCTRAQTKPEDSKLAAPRVTDRSSACLLDCEEHNKRATEELIA